MAVRRMQFELRSDGVPVRSFTLVLNPETYEQEQTGRGTVTYTQGGGWLDADGSNPPPINFAGVISPRKPGQTAEGLSLTQLGVLKEFKTNIIEAYWDMTASDDKAAGVELYFYNWTNREFFSVYPNRFKVLQSVKNPLLHRYEVSLQVLRPIQAGKRADDPVSKLFTDIGIVQRAIESAGKLRWAGAQLSALVLGGSPKVTGMQTYLGQVGSVMDDMVTTERVTNVNYPGIRAYTEQLNAAAERSWTTGSDIIMDRIGQVSPVEVGRLLSDVSGLVVDMEDKSKLSKTPSSVVSLLATMRDKLGAIANTPGLFATPFTVRNDGKFTPL